MKWHVTAPGTVCNPRRAGRRRCFLSAGQLHRGDPGRRASSRPRVVLDGALSKPPTRSGQVVTDGAGDLFAFVATVTLSSGALVMTMAVTV